MDDYASKNDSKATRDRALRFLMAGSVDDGKSTLTGRLLYETQAVFGDQLRTLLDRAAGRPLDLSLLTDGLEAEREQGITIDVAYRYFSTPNRKFIIADAPGHEQYTRNMVTAAAGSDAAVILVDITKLDVSTRPVALLSQTRRHSLLAHLLRVPSIVFAVNKIDAMEDARSAFEAVRESIVEFTRAAGISVAHVLPISALCGNNVTTAGSLPWYDGPSLLEVLEDLPDAEDDAKGDMLFPVHYVARDGSDAGPNELLTHPRRLIYGRIARGSLSIGDTVQIFPNNESAKVVEIRCAGENRDRISYGNSGGIVLDRHIDVTRGNWLAKPHSMQSSQRFAASLAWMDTEPAQLGRKYLIRHGSRWLQGRIVSIESCLDIHTLEPVPAHAIATNDIATVTIETQNALPIEPFKRNRSAGSMIVVDPLAHHTSGVLLVTESLWDDPEVDGRASVRIAVDLSLRYRTQGGEYLPARATNISFGGLLITGEGALRVGGKIEVQIAPHGPATALAPVLTLRARVVDHRPAADGQYHYHLAFYQIGAAEYIQLASLIDSVSHQ